jgi:hypothetical protein
MIYDSYLWFTPGYMIQCGIQARKKFREEGKRAPSEMSKALNESYATAVACLGFNKLMNKEFRLQLVSPQERSPDIRVSYEVPAPEGSRHDEWLNYWDIEVVTLDEHSSEQDADDFLKRTKFAATKSYDQETIILCYINKDIVHGKLWKHVSAELAKLSPQNSTFLLGRTHPTEYKYYLARVHPHLDSLIDVNVREDAQKVYKKSGGTLFANFSLPGQRTTREQRAGINPFLES